MCNPNSSTRRPQQWINLTRQPNVYHPGQADSPKVAFDSPPKCVVTQLPNGLDPSVLDMLLQSRPASTPSSGHQDLFFNQRMPNFGTGDVLSLLWGRSLALIRLLSQTVTSRILALVLSSQLRYFPPRSLLTQSPQAAAHLSQLIQN